MLPDLSIGWNTAAHALWLRLAIYAFESVDQDLQFFRTLPSIVETGCTRCYRKTTQGVGRTHRCEGCRQGQDRGSLISLRRVSTVHGELKNSSNLCYITAHVSRRNSLGDSSITRRWCPWLICNCRILTKNEVNETRMHWSSVGDV